MGKARVGLGQERQLPIIKNMVSPITGTLLHFCRTEYRESKAPGQTLDRPALF